MIWFERSGHAGHYRTLVNQLVSFNLEQVDTLESRINEQVVYWKMEKNPTYTHLFGTIRLLIFNKSPTYTFITAYFVK